MTHSKQRARTLAAAASRLAHVPTIPTDCAKLMQTRGEHCLSDEQERRSSKAIEAAAEALRMSRPEPKPVGCEIREFTTVSSRYGLQSVRVA